jgi:hypothetical protein
MGERSKLTAGKRLNITNFVNKLTERRGVIGIKCGKKEEEDEGQKKNESNY